MDSKIPDDALQDKQLPIRQINVIKKKFKLDFITEVNADGIILIVLASIILIPSSLYAYYFPIAWIYLIGIDLVISSLLVFREYSYTYKIFSIGTSSFFSTSSIAYRVGRSFLYLLLIKLIFQGELIDFFAVFLIFTILGLFVFGFFTSFMDLYPNQPVSLFLTKHSNSIKFILVVVSILLLGILYKMYDIYGIGTWDEGWYADIAYRMFQGQEWFYPLYYQDNTASIKLFDKPPFLFWLGALGIQLFGYSSLAMKWPMGILSGLMGLMGFLIYDHQKRHTPTNIIPPIRSLEEIKIQEEHHELIGRDEGKEIISDAKTTGIIFGLTIGIAWFLAFYGRTSYLDPAIVAFSALTAVFGIKGIDHWFYGNHRRSYAYIFLTAFVNMINLFSKAWQGLIVGIPLGLYLIGRYYGHFVPKAGLLGFWRNAKKKLFSTTNSKISDVIAILGAIITVIGFAIIDETPINNFQLTLEFLDISIWGLFVGLFVFIASRSLIEVYIQNDAEISERKIQDDTSPMISSKLISNGIVFTILIIILSVIAAFIGVFGFDLIFSRFNEAFSQIFVRYLTFVIEEDRVIYSQIITGLIGGFTGGILAFLSIWILGFFALTGIDLIYYIFKKQFWFKHSFAREIVAESSLLLPLGLIGGVLGFWMYRLLQGDAFTTSEISKILNLPPPVIFILYGLLLSITGLILALLSLKFFGVLWERILNRNPDDKFKTQWLEHSKGFILFSAVTLILIVLSFLPFLSWIDWMDNLIVGNEYVIRRAGELSGDANAPSELTYQWLFFDFYLNWRYSSSGNYSVVDSLGGFISPLFIAAFPFFLAGIYAFHKKRDYSTSLFYGSWFLLVLFIFIPAKFQLNYYYLAAFFPYFGLVAFGLFWTLRPIQTALNFKDLSEKALLAIPILILLLVSKILIPLSNESYLNLISTNFTQLALYLISVGITIGGFIGLIAFFVRSIPGLFASMFIVFNFDKYIVQNGLGNIDSEFFLILLVLILIPLFIIRSRFPLSSLFFLLIILLSGAIAMPWWVDYKVNSEDGYERIGKFILEHDGDYNGSTWVFKEAGARYALRYYMQGILAVNDQQFSAQPFTLNSSTSMDSYVNLHEGLKYWVVINRSLWENIEPQSSYSIAYEWLKNNFVWVNPLLNIPSTHHVHLFVDKDVLIQQEIQYLQQQGVSIPG